jgi:hypothetical protein
MTSLETAYHGQTVRALAEHGLRPAAVRACPLIVAGKDCEADSDTRCVCQRHHHVLDHPRAWFDRAGRFAYTAEPYEVDGTDIVDLITDMTALGLRVTVGGRSPWYPGSTFLIVIKPDDDGTREEMT